MRRKTLYKSLLNTLGYVCMFVYLQGFIGSWTSRLAPYFLALGGLLLYFNTRLASVIVKEADVLRDGVRRVLQVVAYIILFLGVKVYVVGFVKSYGLLVFVFGAIVFAFHSEIVDKLFPDEQKPKSL